MSELSIAFLWHMHQPVYKDPFTGKYTLPWVRLHGIKAYYDMPSVVKQYPGIRVNINMVPSLVEQLADYASGSAQDVFYEYSVKPAADLDTDDKAFILKYFFMSNWETMVKPYPRYFELLLKRGKSPNDLDIENMAATFNKQDILDLQVWFNLSWFGFMAVNDYPQLAALKEKQKGFTEQDKKYVLDTQLEIIRKLFPLYRDLHTAGQIEITTSPFYHTIMPLLYDSDTARRCMPKAVLPKRVSYPEDVLAQLKLGRQYIADHLGVAPKGLWPSEGSVSPEIIPMVREAGFEWMVSDEELLFASINKERAGEYLYKPYRAVYKNADISIVFRDKGISNFISFDCARYALREDAVEELRRQILGVRNYLTGKHMDDGIVVIALDGENPWEYYIYGGRRFLNSMYGMLEKTEEIQTTTISSYLGSHKPADTIDNLATGSWINKRFDIWIGQEEKNLAWDYLGATREYFKQNAQGLSAEQTQRALKHLYTAEGSDWFWWYGDTFYTANEEEFDRLFRKNLKKVLEIIKKPMLDFLHTPVIALSEAQLNEQPLGFITPKLDGVPTDYYEWAGGAVCYNISTTGRHNPEPFAHRIYYGFDPDNLYLRIDHNRTKIENEKYNVFFAINIFDHSFEYRVIIPIKHILDSKPYYELHYAKDQIVFDFVKVSDSIAIRKIIELKIPFADIQATPGLKLNMIISARDGDVELEKYPAKGIIGIVVPDQDYPKKMWSV